MDAGSGVPTTTTPACLTWAASHSLAFSRLIRQEDAITNGSTLIIFDKYGPQTPEEAEETPEGAIPGWTLRSTQRFFYYHAIRQAILLGVL